MFFICGFMASGQDVVPSSTITLGVGGLPYSDGAFSPQRGGPSVTGNYEYRLSRHLAVEAGTDILIPPGVALGQISVIQPGQSVISNVLGSGCTGICVLVPSGRSQVSLLTYGFKGVLPVAADRVELFGGIGGAYGWNSVGGRFASAYGQGSVGGRFAVDRGHRFWLGTTLRGLIGFGDLQQSWLPWTFDLGIRFGR